VSAFFCYVLLPCDGVNTYLQYIKQKHPSALSFKDKEELFFQPNSVSLPLRFISRCPIYNYSCVYSIIPFIYWSNIQLKVVKNSICRDILIIRSSSFITYLTIHSSDVNPHPNRRLPTAAARVRAQVRSCGIRGGLSGTGAGFLRVRRFPLPILIPPTTPYLSSGAGTIGQSVAELPSRLSVTPPQGGGGNLILTRCGSKYTAWFLFRCSCSFLVLISLVETNRKYAHTGSLVILWVRQRGIPRSMCREVHRGRYPTTRCIPG
jgi:hypothetical protein